MELICPVCQTKLSPVEKSFYCEKNHCFDRAKSGYVNLLLSNTKHVKIPGDNKLMVNARTNFLDQGYYRSLAEALCEETVSVIRKNGWSSCAVLDAGCGEGYYTNQVYQTLSKSGISLECIGIDISKFALDRAAKRNHDILYGVASVFHLPVQSASCDILFNLFAPFCREEFLRVIKPGGYLFMIIPGKYHLWELKQAIYQNPYPNSKKDDTIPGFHIRKAKKLDTKITLKSQEDIDNLFMMTPYFYKTSKEDSEKVKAFTQMDTRIAFEILVYQKENRYD